MEGKIYNDPGEMKALNEHWQKFIKARRLKVALTLPARIAEFMNELHFVACADNNENISFYYLYPFYEESIYQYHYLIRCKDILYEVEYFTAEKMWCINKMQLKDFFVVTEHVEKSAASLLEEFDPISRLERIRINNICEGYKKRYLQGQVKIADIIVRNDDFYMVFEDGTQAKILRVQ